MCEKRWSRIEREGTERVKRGMGERVDGLEIGGTKKEMSMISKKRFR